MTIELLNKMGLEVTEHTTIVEDVTEVSYTVKDKVRGPVGYTQYSFTAKSLEEALLTYTKHLQSNYDALMNVHRAMNVVGKYFK